MDLRQFYGRIEDIVVFPGSLDDLNRLGKDMGTDRQYRFFPTKGFNKFITGTLIPSEEELEDMTSFAGAAAEKLKGLGEDIGLDQDMLKKVGKIADKASGFLEKKLTSMYASEKMMEMDIRLRAKKLKADGLVHLQLYNKEGMYMAVPIKRI